MPKGTLYVWALPLLAMGLFFGQIHIYWDPDSHYFYGWAVPFLVGYLIWNRLINAPDPGKPVPSLFPLVALCGLSAIFLRFLMEGMPYWYLLAWLTGFALIAFSLCWLAMWRGLHWSLHFVFPLCFVLTAIPWLTAIEAPITFWLTEQIAELVTTSLQILGIPAVKEGALISIGATTVEVAEACSGIRSLQLLLVTALFLGDYGHFRLGKRIFLILCGLIAAFVQNAVRALALGWITGIEGQAAYDKWHDPAGMITVTAGLGLLFAAFLILEKSDPPESLDNKKLQERAPRFCLSLSTLACTVWITAEVFIFLWMRPPTTEEHSHWELDKAALEQMPLYRKRTADESVYRILETYDVSFGEYAYQGQGVSFYNITWPEGQRVGIVNQHTPSTCMGMYGGLTEVGEKKFHTLREPFSHIGYETYLFEDTHRSQMILVFRTAMLPIKYEKLNSNHVKKMWATLDQKVFHRVAIKFGVAVETLKARLNPDLKTHQLILLSLPVDSVQAAEQLILDPAPLEDFVSKLLVEVRP